MLFLIYPHTLAFPLAFVGVKPSRERVPAISVPSAQQSLHSENKIGYARRASSHKICAICGICVRKFPFPPFPRSRIPVFCRPFRAGGFYSFTQGLRPVLILSRRWRFEFAGKTTKMERQDAAPPKKPFRRRRFFRGNALEIFLRVNWRLFVVEKKPFPFPPLNPRTLVSERKLLAIGVKKRSRKVAFAGTQKINLRER